MVRIGGVEEPVRNVMLRLTQLFNITGHPALTLPCGVTSDRLPAGLQIVGAAGATAERIKRLLGNSAAFMSGLQAEDVMPQAAAKVVRWATGFEKKLDGEVEAWDEFLSEIVAEHMEKKRDGGPREEDFLDVLLRLREEGAAGFELTDDYIKSIVKVIRSSITS
jgi:hypothetical protein